MSNDLKNMSTEELQNRLAELEGMQANIDERIETGGFVGKEVTPLEDGLRPREGVRVPRKQEVAGLDLPTEIAGVMAKAGDPFGATTTTLAAAEAAYQQFSDSEKSISDISGDFNKSKSEFVKQKEELSEEAYLDGPVDLMLGASLGKGIDLAAKAKNLSRAGRIALQSSAGAAEGFTRSDKPLSVQGFYNTLLGGTAGAGAEVLFGARSLGSQQRFEELTDETKKFALGVDTLDENKIWDKHMSGRGFDQRSEQRFVDSWINKIISKKSLKKPKDVSMFAIDPKGKMGKDKGVPLFKSGDTPTDMVRSMNTYNKEIYKRVRKTTSALDIEISGAEAKEWIQKQLKGVTQKDLDEVAGLGNIVEDFNQRLSSRVDTLEQVRLPDGSTEYLPRGVKDKVKLADMLELSEEITDRLGGINDVSRRGSTGFENLIKKSTTDEKNMRKLGNLVKNSEELSDGRIIQKLLLKRSKQTSKGAIGQLNQLISFKALTLSGAGAGITGSKAGLLVGGTIAKALQSERLPLYLAKNLDKVVKASQKYPTHGMFSQMLTTMVNNSSDEAKNNALSLLVAKASAKDDPFAQNVESLKVRKEEFLSLAGESFSPQEVADMRNVLENGDDNEIGQTFGPVFEDIPPHMREYVQESIGFDDKLWSPESKVAMSKNIDEMEAPLMYKLQAKKALNLGSNKPGLIPQPPEQAAQILEQLKLQEKRKSFIKGKQGPQY